jgi:hypothetical protein
LLLHFVRWERLLSHLWRCRAASAIHRKACWLRAVFPFHSVYAFHRCPRWFDFLYLCQSTHAIIDKHAGVDVFNGAQQQVLSVENHADSDEHADFDKHTAFNKHAAFNIFGGEQQSAPLADRHAKSNKHADFIIFDGPQQQVLSVKNLAVSDKHTSYNIFSGAQQPALPDDTFAESNIRASIIIICPT